MFSLRSLHALAARLLPPALGALDREPSGDLARLAGCFGWLGVEARLDDDPTLDLAVSLDPSITGRRALARGLDDLADRCPSWQATIAALRRWADDDASPRPSALWLEVDQGREASPPIVFWTTLGLPAAEVEALAAGLAPGRGEAARRLVSWWLRRGAIHHLADLAPRGVDAIRVVGSLAAADLDGLFTAIAWRPDARALAALACALGELADPWTVDVDVGAAGRARLGVECHLPTDPGDDRRWRPILDHAVRAAGASPAKIEALHGWPKRHVLSDILSIHRYLHLKFTFTDRDGPRVKAYLGVHPEIPARAPRGSTIVASPTMFHRP